MLNFQKTDWVNAIQIFHNNLVSKRCRKKRSFPLKISLVNKNKFAASFEFIHIY